MPSEALAQEGCSLHYVYLLESVEHTGQRYVSSPGGETSFHIRARLMRGKRRSVRLGLEARGLDDRLPSIELGPLESSEFLA